MTFVKSINNPQSFSIRLILRKIQKEFSRSMVSMGQGISIQLQFHFLDAHGFKIELVALFAIHSHSGD